MRGQSIPGITYIAMKSRRQEDQGYNKLLEQNKPHHEMGEQTTQMAQCYCQSRKNKS
jgi:hypothetical protein